MLIRFSELLDYDQFPKRGKHNYFSSKVIELDFKKDDVQHFVRCHIDFSYSRWFYPETHWGPKEDECEIDNLELLIIRGYRIHNETEIPLTEKEMRRIHEHVKNEIIFL